MSRINILKREEREGNNNNKRERGQREIFLLCRQNLCMESECIAR
jgi:hypothetical protein